MASFFCKLFTTTKKKFNLHIRKSGSLYFSREIEWRFTYIRILVESGALYIFIESGT